jgi:cytochrome c biogenesis protein CcdA
MLTQPSPPGLGDLISDLSHDFTTLLREELHLAKAEMSAKVVEVRRDVAFIVVAAVLAQAAVLVLCFACVSLLMQAGLTGWGAALVVGAVLLVLGGGLVMMALRRLQSVSLVPQQTIQTLKEDAQWAQSQVHTQPSLK